MRINVISGLFLIIFSQTAFTAVNIDYWKTRQGTRVYYVHTTSLPMVDVQISFDAGSARDGYQFGLASMTSSMFDAGAGEWNADQIAERFASIGAQFGKGVSKDMAWLSVRTLTEPALFDKAMETLHVILSSPSFSEADFERKKRRVLAALKQREESPGALASIAFNKALYKEHPYAHPGAGVIETVAGFGPQHLREFYNQYYVAANAMVVIVGDVDKAKAQQMAEQLMAGLAVSTKPEPLPEVPPLEKGYDQHIDFPSTQTHVLSGLLGKSRLDKDYVTLYVGNHILGGSGLVSKMFKEVREKRGLAYSAYSYFAPQLRTGSFTMGLQTRNDQTAQAVAVMKQTLSDFVEQGPSEKDLIAAKKNITGGFALRIDTNRKLINYVNMIGFYQLPLDYLDSFPARVNAVTAEQIKETFQRRVKPELLQTITAGGQ